MVVAYGLSLAIYRKDHEKAEFEVHEVYAVDVLVSTGEGKVRGLVILFKQILWINIFNNICSVFHFRQRMEVKGPLFTKGTPTKYMA